MSFTQKDYVVSHTLSTISLPYQPAMFKLDLSALVPFGDHSSLFLIERMSLTAYKRGTCTRIPVKFTVLNHNKTRVITNDPCKMSSDWRLECGSYKIAGTDNVPFTRTVAVHEDDNRQALLNAMTFMMSGSLRASQNAKRAFQGLGSMRGEYKFTCDMCSQPRAATVIHGTTGPMSFVFPECETGDMCIPRDHTHNEVYPDGEASDLYNLLTFIRCVTADNLLVVRIVTQELMCSDVSFQDLEYTCFPPKNMYRGGFVLSYSVMEYVTVLYQTMCDYADTFAIIHKGSPHVKVLVESPSDSMGEITGCMTLTLLYGNSLLDIYTRLLEEANQGDCEAPNIPTRTDVIQLTPDVLIRRTSLKFHVDNAMHLHEWCRFYMGRD